MKKAVFTLDVNKYAPKITRITRPWLGHYAKKIGADLVVIDKRKFPNFPPVYEKLQIHELGRGYDWSIFFDADCLIHPDLFDITTHLNKDTVLQFSHDLADVRFKSDIYFQRDGRHIGCGGWLSVVSDLCLDFFKPLDDITFEEALANISVINNEKLVEVSSDHLIDDYVTSRNLARYGLKHTTFIKIVEALEKETQEKPYGYFAHNGALDEQKKIEFLEAKIKEWRI